MKYPSILLCICFMTGPFLKAQDNLGNLWLSVRLQAGQHYDQFVPLDSFRAKVELDGRFGLLDRRGTEICAPLYDEIGMGSGLLYAVNKDGRYGAINQDGVLVIPCVFSNVRTGPGAKGCTALKDSLWAVFDWEGREILPFQFYVEPQLDSTSIVSTIDRVHFGAWNWLGNQTVPQHFHQLEHLEMGFWDAGLFGKHALLTPEGLTRSNFIYQRVFALPAGAFIGQKSDREYEMVDASGQRITGSSYAYQRPVGKGWYTVMTRDANWLVTPKGAFSRLPGGFEIITNLQCPDDVFITRLQNEEDYEQKGWYNLRSGESVYPQFNQVFFRQDTVYALAGDKSGKYSLAGKKLESLPYSTTGELAAPGHFIFLQNERRGVMNFNFQIVLPPIFDDLGLYEGGYMVRKGERTGFYDLKGIEIIPVQFEQVYLEHGITFFYVTKGKLYGTIGTSGNTLIPPEYARLETVDYGNFVAQKQGKWGLISRNGAVLLPFVYDKIERFYNQGKGQYLLLEIGKKRGWADAKGRIILPVVYLAIIPGWAINIACKDGQCKGYNKEGRVIIPENCLAPSNGLGFILAIKNGRYGMYSKMGGLLIPFEYDTLMWDSNFLKGIKNAQIHTWQICNNGLVEGKPWGTSFSPGLNIIEKNGKKGLFDATGNTIWSPEYDKIYPLSYSAPVAMVSIGTEYRILDNLGQTLFDFQADSLITIPDGRFVYYKYQGQGMVLDLQTFLQRQTRGNEWFLYQPDLEMILASMAEAGRYKMFDENLEPIEPAMTLLNREGEYSNRYTVTLDGKLGLIGKRGEILLQPEFDQFYYWMDSILLVENEGLKGLLDLRSGRRLPIQFSEIYKQEPGTWFAVQKDGLNGYYDSSFNLVIPVKYQSISPFSQHLFIVQRNGLFGLVNQKGEELMKPDYERIETVNEPLSNPDNPVLLYGRFYKDGQAGILGKDGSVLITAQYSNIYDNAYFFFCSKGDNNLDIYNRKGQLLLSGWQGYYEDHKACFLIMKSSLNQGVLDSAGRWVLPLIYDDIQGAGAYFIVKKNGKFGIFKLDGTQVLPLESDAIAPPYDGSPFFFIWRNGHFRHFDGQHRWLETAKYDYADPFVRGLAAVRSKGKWGYIDTSGQVVIPIHFDYAEPFHDFNGQPRAVVLWNKGYYFIDSLGYMQGAYTAPRDKSKAYFYRPLQVEKGFRRLVDEYGRLIFESKDYNIMYPQSGLLVSYPMADDPCRHSGEGLLDFAGNVIAFPIYTRLWTYNFAHSDLAPVKVGLKYGYINRKGKMVIQPIYDLANPFCEFSCGPNPKAKVAIGEKEWWIDLKGNDVK